MNNTLLLSRTFCMLLICLIYPVTALATGPRIKQDLFTPDANSIYALDFPPFITSELSGNGIAIELANAALQAEKISVSVNMLPLPRMLKYYVFQEKALALIGSHLSFTTEEQKDLIFIPLLKFKEHYFVYQPNHPEGLTWNGDLKVFAKRVYGAEPEENVSPLQKADVQIVTGKLLNLLEKLKAGQIDFIGNSDLAVNWFLDRNLSADKAQFIKLEPLAGDETIFVIFNKKHPEGENFAQKFKLGLASIIANGRYQALLEKHLGDSQSVDSYILPLK